jgi:hypothetical protein
MLFIISKITFSRLRNDSLYRTYIITSPAIGAQFRINGIIFIPFSNRISRAFIVTIATGGAFFCDDLIGHFSAI